MEATVSRYTLSIPNSDISFFKKLVAEKGWVAQILSYAKPDEGSNRNRVVADAMDRSARLRWLQKNPISLRAEDLEDDRTRYILDK